MAYEGARKNGGRELEEEDQEKRGFGSWFWEGVYYKENRRLRGGREKIDLETDMKQRKELLGKSGFCIRRKKEEK